MSRSSPEKPLKCLISNISTHILINYDGLEDYINTSIKLSEKTSNDIAKKIKIWDKENAGHEYSGHDIYENDFFSLIKFDGLVLTSAIILTHSELEGNLRHICDSIGRLQNKKIRLDDIRGQGHIDQCKNYLEKVFDIDFSQQKNEWEEIFAFNRLRNIIAHQNGVLTIKQDQKVQQTPDFKTLSKINNIVISDFGQVKISSEKTVKQFIKASRTILSNVCEELKRK